FDVKYVNDDLNRLTEADEGTLDGSDAITSRTRKENWTLSHTGNWLEHKLDANGDGIYTRPTGTDFQAANGDLEEVREFAQVNELFERKNIKNIVGQHSRRVLVPPPASYLQSREPLHGHDIVGQNFQSRSTGRDRVVRAAGALQRERKVHPRIGVPRHELACPLELRRGFVELITMQEDHAQVVVGRAVIEVGVEGFTQQRFGLLHRSGVFLR
ncbi:MAG TPA: hypothetical protein VF777_02350, partial [Phycisphaerales bacterium]